MKLKLTKSNIDALSANGKRYIVWDVDLAGFGLRVSQSTNGVIKTFILRQRMPGARRAAKDFTIGRYGVLTPAEARKLAIELKAEVGKGNNPTKEVKTRAEVPTLKEAIAAYMESRTLSERTIEEYDREFEYSKKLHGLSLSDVTHEDINWLHKNLTKDRGPYVANRVVSILGSVFKANTANHDIKNPVTAWHAVGHKSNPKRRREVDPPHVVLPRWRRGIEETIEVEKIKDLLMWGFYTGIRRNEICRLQFSRIDEEAGTYTVTQKGGGDLTLPLIRQLNEILEHRRDFVLEGCDWVFPNKTGRRRDGVLPSGPMTSLKIGNRTRYQEISEAGGAKFYMHAERNVFLTICRDLGYPDDMSKRLCGHELNKATGDVTRGYTSKYGMDVLRRAAQAAADRIEILSLEKIDAEELVPSFIIAAESKNAAVMGTSPPVENVDYSLVERIKDAST
jgi:integrase